MQNRRQSECFVTSSKWKPRKRPRPSWSNGRRHLNSIISFILFSAITRSEYDSLLKSNNSMETNQYMRFAGHIVPLAEAVAASPHPFRETFEDGSISPLLYINGNHQYSYLTDESGFTVMHDNTVGGSSLYYATRHIETGEMVKTNLVVGTDDPFNATEMGVLRGPHELPLKHIISNWDNCGKFCVDDGEWEKRFPHLYDNNHYDSNTLPHSKNSTTLNHNSDRMLHNNDNKNNNNIRRRNNKIIYTRENRVISTRFIRSAPHSSSSSLLGKSQRSNDYSRGTLRNLVVLIRFSDHSSRKLPTKQQVEVLMNRSGGHPIYAPSGSVKDLFVSNSYGKFSVVSTVMDWITLPFPEAYYADSSSGSTEKYENALREALDRLDSNPNFSFSKFDHGKDGSINAIMFLHSGYGAEWGRTDCYGQQKIDRIWAHKWNIEPAWESKQGYQVSRYHTSSALWGTCGSDIARIGTISHEIGHILGLPDLYSGGSGIGSFGIMGNSWGFDGTQHYPPSFSAWSKVKMGWVEPKTVTTDGLYYIKASQKYPDIYKLSLGYSQDEYILIENRQAIDFDSKMPQGGIAIWHIDESISCINAPGYPGQIDWPQNGYHYTVSLLQPDGMYDLEKGANRGDVDDVWHADGISQRIGPSINTKYGPYPNTDSYQGGKIKQTGHIISDFSKSDMTMTFKVTLGKNNLINSVPHAQPTSKPTLAPTPPPLPFGTKSELETSMTGDTGSCGNFFDVLNTSAYTVTILSLDIHTRHKGKNLEIEVYTKPGSHLGFEQKPKTWTKVASTIIRGLGYLNLTPIPKEDFQNVNIKSGESQTFYVTFKNPDIRYTKRNLEDFGETSVLNGDLEIFIGSGVGSYPFGSLYRSREWNGKIHYIKNDQQRSPASDQEFFKLKTTFEQNNGSYGSMFNVVAFRSLAISSMDIHIRETSNFKLEIYTKLGSYIDHENNPDVWTKIVDTTIKGVGVGWPTTIPSGIFPSTIISKGETRAFYVTLDSANLRYTTGMVESINSDLAITDSAGIGGYPFGPVYTPRMWNGSLRYHFIKDDDFSSNSNALQHDTPQELVTTFLNGNGSYGIQFDIIALKSIRIVTFDIHTKSKESIVVEVYTKQDTHKNHEQKANDWSLICQTSIRGRGLMERTPIPSSSFSSIQIMPNMRQAFYITMRTPDLRYSNGDPSETKTAFNDHLQVLDGSGIGSYPFGKVYPQRMFNGVIKYFEVSSEDKELATTMKGGNGSYGCIFHIKSSKSVQIYSISTNVVSTGIINIEVWTSPGPFTGSKKSLSGWSKVSDAVLFGNGKGIQTEIPQSDFKPVQVKPNETQLFYVTLKKPELRYTNGDTNFSDGDVEIFDGIGVGSYPLESAPLYNDRIFNGKIKYR